MGLPRGCSLGVRRGGFPPLAAVLGRCDGDCWLLYLEDSRAGARVDVSIFRNMLQCGKPIGVRGKHSWDNCRCCCDWLLYGQAVQGLQFVPKCARHGCGWVRTMLLRGLTHTRVRGGLGGLGCSGGARHGVMNVASGQSMLQTPLQPIAQAQFFLSEGLRSAGPAHSDAVWPGFLHLKQSPSLRQRSRSSGDKGFTRLGDTRGRWGVDALGRNARSAEGERD